jgi:hypothetical protein
MISALTVTKIYLKADSKDNYWFLKKCYPLRNWLLRQVKFNDIMKIYSLYFISATVLLNVRLTYLSP